MTVFSSGSPARSLRSIALVIAAGLAVAGCGSAVPIAGDYRAVGTITPAKSQFSGTHPHDFPIHGIDVSRYQGDIDWDSVRRSGITFAYIKATEGSDRIDSKFMQNWQGAKAAGIKRGAYHFAYWCRTSDEEMRNFLATVPNDPDALPPVLDVEATPTSRTCRKTLERGETVAKMREMLRMMERAYGKRPVIYSTVDFYEAILHPSELEEYPIWVRSTKYSPHVRYGNRKWHFWQYQSDAQIPGIRGNVDRNAFGGDQRQWLAFAGGQMPTTAMGYAAQAPAAAAAPIPGAVAQAQPAGFAPPVNVAGASNAASTGAVLPPIDPDE